MKVVLVDDSEVVRRSLGHLLATVPGVEIVGGAEDVAGARRLIDAQRPDLVVLDLELRRGESGADVLRDVMRRHPATAVIVLSNFTGQARRAELLAAGALAYFDKATEFGRARDWIAARAAVGDATPRPG